MKITEIFSLGHDGDWGGDHRWRQDDWDNSWHRDDWDRGRWSDWDHRDC
ncbi:MAG: hypothetical protein ACRDQU_04230 [Pseudonocardiaceae bacterium]